MNIIKYYFRINAMLLGSVLYIHRHCPLRERSGTYYYVCKDGLLLLVALHEARMAMFNKANTQVNKASKHKKAFFSQKSINDVKIEKEVR